MNTTIDQTHAGGSATADKAGSSPAYQAYRILHFGFVVAPILAGLDKFFHLLVNWDQYLPGVVARISPIPPHTLMLIVGVIEIVAGIGVAIKPRIFAYVVAAWLAVIIINLLLIPGYFDIALRDFGLLLAALALGGLSKQFASRQRWIVFSEDDGGAGAPSRRHP
ncbi:MAG TPA: hypothetical protein VGM65_00045 [Candidatus Udaeobacter sp.]